MKPELLQRIFGARRVSTGLQGGPIPVMKTVSNANFKILVHFCTLCHTPVPLNASRRLMTSKCVHSASFGVNPSNFCIKFENPRNFCAWGKGHTLLRTAREHPDLEGGPGPVRRTVSASGPPRRWGERPDWTGRSGPIAQKMPGPATLFDPFPLKAGEKVSY